MASVNLDLVRSIFVAWDAATSVRPSGRILRSSRHRALADLGFVPRREAS
jgi:hypothetical protein